MFKKKTPVYNRIADAALPKKKTHTKKKALAVGLITAGLVTVAGAFGAKERDLK